MNRTNRFDSGGRRWGWLYLGIVVYTVLLIVMLTLFSRGVY